MNKTESYSVVSGKGVKMKYSVQSLIFIYFWCRRFTFNPVLNWL